MNKLKAIWLDFDLEKRLFFQSFFMGPYALQVRGPVHQPPGVGVGPFAVMVLCATSITADGRHGVGEREHILW